MLFNHPGLNNYTKHFCFQLCNRHYLCSSLYKYLFGTVWRKIHIYSPETRWCYIYGTQTIYMGRWKSEISYHQENNCQRILPIKFEYPPYFTEASGMYYFDRLRVFAIVDRTLFPWFGPLDNLWCILWQHWFTVFWKTVAVWKQ